MEFWIIITAFSMLVAGFLVFSILKNHPSTKSNDVELQFYKSQLVEISRDLERDIILDDEAKKLRTEVARRILKLDDHKPSPSSSVPHFWLIALSVVIILTVVGGSVGLYALIGSPGYGDLAQADRIALAEANRKTRPSLEFVLERLPEVSRPLPNKTYSELVIKLRETVKTRANDLEGHLLLASVETGLQNFIEASKALSKAIKIKGDEATAEDFFDYAELLILAAQGYVSPEAEAALMQALERDIRFSAAHYYLGLMMAQNDRPDRAFQIWRRLLLNTPEDSPWIEPIRAQIEDAAIAAGINDFELPQITLVEPFEPQNGPTQDEIKAAEDISKSERIDMIQGMVQGLSERLATQGGNVQEWAQLIRALIVLEQEDKAAAIWENAKSVFAQYPDDLEFISRVAKEIGIVR